MVERNDPARAGVKAGRVVGLLTASVAVGSLLTVQETFYRNLVVVFGLLGIDPWRSVSALFWGNAILTAVARYSMGYVVGSLLGVVYDWLEHSLLVVVGLTLLIGVVDGLFAVFDTRNVLIGGAYLLAWLCYIPAFVWLFDAEAGEDRSTPKRLGSS